MKSAEVCLLFATPVYFANTELVVNKEVYETLEYKRMSYNNGDISTEKFVLDNPKFKEIKDTILLHLNLYAYDVLKVNKSIEFYLTNSWITRHHQNDYSQTHSHYNSIFSGCFYLDVSEESGDFIIENNPLATNIFTPTLRPFMEDNSNINANDWIVKPKKGDLILFPSTVLHSVNQNKTNKPRYSLAFNTFMRGSLGDFIDRVELK